MRYEFIGGNLALDFANTVHNQGTADPGDDLKAPADLIEWVEQAGLSRRIEATRLRKGAADEIGFRRALTLREAIYQIFSRAAEGRKPEADAIRRFQGFYRSALRHVEFLPTEDHYRLAWPARTGPWDHALRQITQSAADLLTSGALTRVRQCSGENCSWLFLDTSRNGLRRWCEMKACGNRAKVERFRRRKRVQ